MKFCCILELYHTIPYYTIMYFKVWGLALRTEIYRGGRVPRSSCKLVRNPPKLLGGLGFRALGLGFTGVGFRVEALGFRGLGV